MGKLCVEMGGDAVARLAGFIEETLDGADAPMKAAAQINIAADEILSNIASYSGAGRACVSVEITEAGAELEFSDDGAPYDPTKQEDPDVTLSAEERGIGGLGIFMVRKFMDSIEYSHRDGMNCLRITKKFA